MPNTPPPSTSITPLEGKTTIDDKMFFDPERLSYEGTVEIAKRITREIKELVKGKIVVIAGTRLLADFANLQSIVVLLDYLRRDYDSIAKQSQSLVNLRFKEEEHLETFVSATVGAAAGTISSVLTPATAVVGAALGLISLFRQDVEYHGEKTLVDELAFEIALAAQLTLHGAHKVYLPDLVVLTPLGRTESLLQTKLNDVQQSKADAWSSVGPLVTELVRLESDLDVATKKKDQTAVDDLSGEVSRMRRDLAPIVDPLSRLDQRLSDLQNQLNQTDLTTGLVELARLLRAETLQRLQAVYVHATIVSSGGYYRITRNLFRTLFMGDGLSFAGGATARWALLATDGAVTCGGIATIGLKGQYGSRHRAESVSSAMLY